ncbi:hypothetical protein [Actinocrinis sp.]|uniref:hypothetical protein n=1 Tax=Actinocrinis sp. TaxID=1920516 RepID=UPI002D400DD1|nr:hypothetical protein [Actinocrinis sp.]HZP54345.1 hypothetical protein [Actinocrinis sp.]
MPDLDAEIRAKLDGWLDDFCGTWRDGCPHRDHDVMIRMRAALIAVLDKHHNDGELHVCYQCEVPFEMDVTVRAIAKELGVEADGG